METLIDPFELRAPWRLTGDGAPPRRSGASASQEWAPTEDVGGEHRDRRLRARFWGSEE